MATYSELKEQAEKLLAEAEQLREQEIAQAISEIREKIAFYGLTPQDLGFQHGKTKAVAKKSLTPMKYRGPEGQTWSGGRGRKPDWVLKALQNGRNLEEFRISSH